MILWIENPEVSIHKPGELINELSKVAGYKINIQNQLCSYILTMKWQKGNENKQSLLKHLGINLTKEVKDIWWEL